MRKRTNPIDHPGLVNFLLALAVVTHAMLTGLELVPNLWAPFLKAPASEQSGVYLGFVGGAAIVSGFAGVVVVFGLSGASSKFREFRVLAGKSLSRNWTSTSSSGLFAAALGLAASVSVFSGGAWLGPWFFELGIAFVLHSSARLIFLLRGLVGIVGADDVAQDRAAKKKPVAEAPWHRRAS